MPLRPRFCSACGAPVVEAAELGWFLPDRLPDRIAFKNGRRVIADWRRARA